MKLTKSKLKQLIKEEIRAAKFEQKLANPPSAGWQERIKQICLIKDAIFASLNIKYVRDKARKLFIDELIRRTKLKRTVIEIIIKVIEKEVGYTIEDLLNPQTNKEIKQELRELLDLACAFF